MPDTEDMKADEPLASRMPGMRRTFGVAGSLALHLILLLPFIVNLSLPSHDKPQEETVSVEIVPPPEPEPEPAPKPEPPAPEKPEPSAPEPPPPPQPEPKPEPPQQQAGQPAPPIPTLRPVFRFGEETRGPEQKADGNSAEEAEKPVEPAEKPVEEPKPAETAEVKPTEAEAAEKPAETPAEAEATGETAEAKAPAASPLEAPQVDAAALALLTSPTLSDTGASEPGAADVVLPDKVVRPTPRPASAAAAVERPIPELQEAKRLYSSSRTGDQAAMTAMAGIPRGERAGQLCASELQAQLRNGSPSYRPELIPAYTLAPGTTALKIGRGAFRAEGVWYDVSFSCQVNAEATEIQSFSYAVGSRIPRSEWRSRGFPNF